MPDAVSRFSGFAAQYDAARPVPPADLVALIRQWACPGRAGTGRAGTEQASSGQAGPWLPDVVDVGAGTGLSTMIWAGQARHVIAVEPSAGMRALAARKAAAASAGGTRFTVAAGTAEDTGLADGCADIVTASQAMHWFDAGRALPEIVRVLRPGGVFASYDCDWPPCVHWEVDAAYAAFDERVARLETARGLRPPHAGKDHRVTMAASGLFRHVTDVAVHACDRGAARRLVAVALSQGGAVALLDAGLTEDDIGVTALREVALRRLTRPVTWWWTYRIRLGVTPDPPSTISPRTPGETSSPPG